MMDDRATNTVLPTFNSFNPVESEATGVRLGQLTRDALDLRIFTSDLADKLHVAQATEDDANKLLPDAEKSKAILGVIGRNIFDCIPENEDKVVDTSLENKTPEDLFARLTKSQQELETLAPFDSDKNLIYAMWSFAGYLAGTSMQAIQEYQMLKGLSDMFGLSEVNEEGENNESKG